MLVLIKSRRRIAGDKVVDAKRAHTKKTAASVKPPLEHEVQAAVISWARASAYLQDDPLKRKALEIYHAIPNGAKVIRMQKPRLSKRTGKPLPPREALKLKAEGLTPGIEDTFLDWPSRDVDGHIEFAGFYIEYKRPGGKPEPHQLEMMKAHRALGYRAELFDDPERAARAIIEHMGLTKWAALPHLREWRRPAAERRKAA